MNAGEEPPPSQLVLIQATAGRGFAASNNSEPADILVVATEPITGAAVTDLIESDFAIISHFSSPGQTCGFSNNITTFNNVGTGAYQLQVELRGCTWVSGDFLIQVIVSSNVRSGQAVAKFTII